MFGVVQNHLQTAAVHAPEAEALIAAVFKDCILATVVAAAQCVKKDLEEIYHRLVSHGAGDYAAVALLSPVTLAYLVRAHKHASAFNWSRVAADIILKMGRL